MRARKKTRSYRKSDTEEPRGVMGHRNVYWEGSLMNDATFLEKELEALLPVEAQLVTRGHPD